MSRTNQNSNAMKVFFIWSGPRSHEIARGLKELLETCVQGPSYFISDEIEGGQLWRYVLANELSETDFGIVCVTPENLDSRWVHFEAGALAKAVSEARVVPYLHDLRPTDVEQPLGDFQARILNEGDTLRLVKQVAESSGAANEDAVERIFEEFAWDEFDDRISDLPEREDGEGRQSLRDDSSKIDEILQRLRSQGGGWSGSDPRAIQLEIPRFDRPIPIYAYVSPVETREEEERDPDTGEMQTVTQRGPKLPSGAAPMSRRMMGYTEDSVIVITPDPIDKWRELSEDELREELSERDTDFSLLVKNVKANVGAYL